jgi:hypothetical protein
MVEGDDTSILNMKFIFCFEWLSGLKINYQKSEAFIFGKNEDESRRIANMMNCKMGELPMTYLGNPLSDTKLGMRGFFDISKKIAKRIPPWKGKHMSLGGRLILSNSCLASLPTYVMGFYLLPQGNHRKMDYIRSRFFWRGVGARDASKYHMVRWDAVCRPMDLSGLGIINTQTFNECLIVKWIWKMYHQIESLWVRLLKAKYMKDEDFFKSKDAHGSQFWKGLYKVKHHFKWGPSTKWGMRLEHNFEMMFG